MPDIPFYEAAAQAEKLVKDGAIIHQKFTCDRCGSRQTMEQENAFFTQGKCEECSHVTDLQDKGCGYAVIIVAV